MLRKDAPSPLLRLYAHCSSSGGVVLFGANMTPSPVAFALEPPLAGGGRLQEFALSPGNGGDLRSRSVLLNGEELRLGPGGAMPRLEPKERTEAGSHLALKAFQIAFWNFPDVVTPACSKKPQPPDQA